MIFNLSVGNIGKKRAPEFTYTGSYLFETSTDEDGTVHYDLALLTSGTLTFSKSPYKAAVFLQGGGESGSKGTASSGGPGGHGGKRLETYFYPRRSVEYAVTIGGAGEDTSAFGLSTMSGSRVAYGGGTTENSNKNGQNGAVAFDGTCLISAFSGIKFGASGGKGAYRNSGYVIAGQGSGGNDGGGAGGHGFNDSDFVWGGAGGANTGSGGGGGHGDGTAYGATRIGGAGGTGVVLIRDIR